MDIKIFLKPINENLNASPRSSDIPSVTMFKSLFIQTHKN